MKQLGLLLALLMPVPAFAGPQVVILKSARADGKTALKPYDQAADAVESVLGKTTQVLVTPKIPASDTTDSVNLHHPQVVICFGVEAAAFAADYLPDIPRVVGLAPGVTPGSGGPPTVLISSEVLPDTQMKWVAEVLPDVERVGVIYDPRYSAALLDDLSAAAATRSEGRRRPLSIVRIPVSSESEVPDAFKKALPSLQALFFVPDPTVTSRGTIRYLLEKTEDARLPAIGFNWYFVDNGAVLGFGIDYKTVGRQAARAAKKLLSDPVSESEMPARITVWVNLRVADKLGIKRLSYDPDKVQEIR